MVPDPLNLVFTALGHHARREMLDIIKERPGCSVNDVCDFFAMSRIGVMKHLRILEQANLVRSEKIGRSRQLYFNAVPIQMIYDRWTTEFSAYWASGLTQIKYRIESARPSGRSKATELEAESKSAPSSSTRRKRHA